MPIKLVIDTTARTKKNHQVIRYRWSNRNGVRKKVPFIAQNDVYKQYEDYCLWRLKEQYKGETIDYKVNVKSLYYMPTHRKIDLTNLHAALHDILVKAKILEDDNCKIIVSTDGSRVLYDHNNPRTEVYIEKIESEV